MSPQRPRCTKTLVTGEMCGRWPGQCIHNYVSPPFGGQVGAPNVLERYFQYHLAHRLRQVQAEALRQRAYDIVEMLDEPIAEAVRLAEIHGSPRH